MPLLPKGEEHRYGESLGRVMVDMIPEPVKLDLTDPETERVEAEVIAAIEGVDTAPSLVGQFLAQWESDTPRWTVDSVSRAEHAMRRVAKADETLKALDEARQAFMAEVQAAYDAAVRPIEEWWTAASRPLLASKAFFEEHLRRFALARRAEDDQAKSLIVPSGRVQTREGRQSVTVTDMDLLLRSVTDVLPPELLETDIIKKEVRKSELLKVCHIVEMADGGLRVAYNDQPLLGIVVERGEITATVTAEQP
jgi:hypothetical protein